MDAPVQSFAAASPVYASRRHHDRIDLAIGAPVSGVTDASGRFEGESTRDARSRVRLERHGVASRLLVVPGVGFDR
jgi:hypothetical protein